MLLQVCAELNTGRMDRSRPLWQVWLLTGLAEGRTGLFIRLHHVVADGIAALAMLGALFDPDPAAHRAAVPAWAPEPVPAARELAADELRRAARALAGAASRVRHPLAVAARLGGLARQAGQLARDGPAPRVSLNVPVSGHHRLLLVRADLERSRAVAHARGGTINDLVLAAVAGGAQRLLASRGELSPGLVLRASVAASVRAAADQPATGNQVGVMIVPLPVGEADPGHRLALIARATAQRKRQPAYQPSARLLQRWMVGMMSRQRLVNLLVSNLPGPAAPLFLASRPVLEISQFGVVQGRPSGAPAHARGRLPATNQGVPMTAVSNYPGHAARTQQQLPRLIGHEFHADLRCYWRNTQSMVFTFLLPVLFLVVFASIFRNASVKVPGGSIKASVYYVPAIITFGLIAAAFSNLILTIVRNRESGIYKRRGSEGAARQRLQGDPAHGRLPAEADRQPRGAWRSPPCTWPRTGKPPRSTCTAAA